MHWKIDHYYVSHLLDWLHSNRLSLNANKMHIMIFGPKSKPNLDKVIIKIDETILNLVTFTKFLGVILDSNINWKNHISYISTKIAKSIGILSIARKTLPQKTLIQLYFSLIYPYLTYCIIIWGNSPSSTLWPVLRLQKIALRLISNLRYRQSSLPFCKLHTILRLPEIYIHSAAMFMYKFKNSLLPQPFDDFFQDNSNYHRYPTRSANNIRIPLVKTQIADKFIIKSGAQIWNTISNEVDISQKIGPFKGALKLHLTRKFYWVLLPWVLTAVYALHPRLVILGNITYPLYIYYILILTVSRPVWSLPLLDFLSPTAPFLRL